MFIVHTSTGKTYLEGVNVPHWDALPDEGITSIQITLPHKRPHTNDNATITIGGKYDRYYCAYQAVAQVLTMAGNEGSMTAGQGTITHQVVAAIDDERNEVVYLEVNVTTGDVKAMKFDIEQLKVAPHSFKKGAKK